MFPPISTRRLLRTPGFNSNAGIPGLEEEAAAAINPAPPASTRPRRATLPPAGPGVDVPPMGSNDGTMDAIAQIAARTLGDSTSPTGAPANTPTGSAPITQTPVNGARPRYADPIDNARQEHMLAYDEKKPPRWKQALETAGLAFLQGAASNPQNPLAAGIGAAAAGGALGAFKPDMAEEYQFEAYERPGIEEGIQRDQKREDRETQRRKDTFEEIFRAAQAERQLAEAADIPVKRATDQQRYTNEQNRKNAEDQFKRQQHQDLQKYRQDQLELQKGKLQATDKPDYQEGERLFPMEEADAIARDSTEARRAEIVSKLPTWAQNALNDPVSTQRMRHIRYFAGFSFLSLTSNPRAMCAIDDFFKRHTCWRFIQAPLVISRTN